jgi:hypothetical protein
LDVDVYDARSRHYGLYIDDDGSPSLIGGIRVVEDRETDSRAYLESLANQYGLIERVLKQVPEYPLPYLNYYGDIGDCQKVYKEIKKANHTIVDPGRLLLDSKYRSLHLAKFLIESAIAIYFVSSQAVDYAALACKSSQAKCYFLYGFSPINGAHMNYIQEKDVTASALIGCPSDVPSRLIPKLNIMAESFEGTGRIPFMAKKITRRETKHSYLTNIKLAII